MVIHKASHAKNKLHFNILTHPVPFEAVALALYIVFRFIIMHWQCALTPLISTATTRRPLPVAIVSWYAALKKQSGSTGNKNRSTHAQKNTSVHSGGHNRGGMKWSVIRVRSHAPASSILCRRGSDERLLNRRRASSCTEQSQRFPCVFFPWGWRIKRQFTDNFLLLQSREAKDDQSINCEGQTGI